MILNLHAATTTFTEVKLVGSDASVGAQQIDRNLVNPWGISHGPGGPLWISDNVTGKASIYSVSGDSVTINPFGPFIIAPPAPGPGTAAPDGQVFNTFQGSGAFTLSDGSPALFLFATEDGTISGWNPQAGTQSIIAVNESVDPADGDEKLGLGAVYKGLAIGFSNHGPTLYAANFRHNSVDMFDKNFNTIGSFTDKHLPPGYAPFNVQVLDNKLFVTFALQNGVKHDDVGGAHHGFVDEFDLNGNFIARIASGGTLDSPWGMAIAPSKFGTFAGDLLVGNFGDGTINAFDLKNDMFVGKLTGADGKPIVIGDLWAITPGGGGMGGSPGSLFFTAGVLHEQHGLFGSLTPNPSPAV
jgi:uncharacterized protein (TIGR03118 family)